MSQLLALVNLLLSYGPKLPAAAEIVERIVGEFQELYDLFAPGRAAPAPVALSPEVQEGLDKLRAAMGHGAGREGFFTNVMQFLAAHPKAVDALLLILPALLA